MTTAAPTRSVLPPGASATGPEGDHLTTRPRPFPLVRHSLALAGRSLVKTRRTPEALIDVTLQPVLIMVTFVYIFGASIAGSTHDYLQYLLPGILAQSIAQGAVSIGVNLNSDLEKGIFDRFRSLPIPRSAPLVGAVLGDVVRYVIVAVVTIGFGYVMGFRIGTDPLSMLAGCALAVLFALSLSWVSVFVGMKARTSGSVQGMMFMLLMPLSFASNIFVDPTSLPGWMQGFVDANPLSHLVGAMRALFLGGPAGPDVLWTLGWCVGLVAVFLPLAMRAYRKRV
ncbi:ABC transporter permease [Cellulomonas sp. P22]|uniref:ABC transporter permease n=1 Tax=Cellulomonas sp. P22 TaxID=3373189 RepID=UPI00379573BC